MDESNPSKPVKFAYTFYFIDGKKFVLYGNDPADALNEFGILGHTFHQKTFDKVTLNKVAFLVNGVDNSFCWNKIQNIWKSL